MLVKNYYSITNQQSENDDITRFDVALHTDCDVYKGHFPGEPVSPGVCNIQMLKECAERVVGKPLLFNYIQQCRLTTLVTPVQHSNVEVRIRIVDQLDNGIKWHGTIGRGTDVYMDLKGEASFA
ncbi:MAG: beta-hydroxyacyl-ACP dehydratase [Paludibacteraceae bacterium]